MTFRPGDVIAATGGFIAEAHISRTVIVWNELGKSLEYQRVLRIGERRDNGDWARAELTPQAAELLVKTHTRSSEMFGDTFRSQIRNFVEKRGCPEGAVKDVVKVVEDFLEQLSSGDAVLAAVAV